MAKFVGVDIFDDKDHADTVAQQYRTDDISPRVNVRVIKASGGIGLAKCVSATGECSSEYESNDSVYIVYSELEVE